MWGNGEDGLQRLYIKGIGLNSYKMNNNKIYLKSNIQCI